MEHQILSHSDSLKKINEELDSADPGEILEWAFNRFGGSMVMGTGFGPSGMVLLHYLNRHKLDVPVFYLDTHLLFQETYDLRDRLEEQFNVRFIRVGTSMSIRQQDRKYGERLWDSNPDKCCYMRKVEPLKEFLDDKGAWVTGIRRQQADTRADADIVEWDAFNRVNKINPLAHWSSEEIWTYIRLNELPYNPLHDHGYPSIGCIPCTSKASASNDERAGRWAGMSKTECGIHQPQSLTNGNKTD